MAALSGLMKLSNLPVFLGGALAGLLAWANVPPRRPANNHVDLLRDAPLKALTEGGRDGAGAELWGRGGAVVMATRRPG